MLVPKNLDIFYLISKEAMRKRKDRKKWKKK